MAETYVGAAKVSLSTISSEELWKKTGRFVGHGGEVSASLIYFLISIFEVPYSIPNASLILQVVRFSRQKRCKVPAIPNS